MYTGNIVRAGSTPRCADGIPFSTIMAAASRHQLDVGCSFSSSERQEGVAMHSCSVASMAGTSRKNSDRLSPYVHSALRLSEGCGDLFPKIRSASGAPLGC